MGTKSFNYSYLAKRFVTMPFILVLAMCSVIYLISDMIYTMHHEVAYVKNINKILAKTATTQNTELINAQVKNISQLSPQIESINFFPTTMAQTVNNDDLTLGNIFFGDYYGLNVPVVLQLNYQTSNDQTHVNQLIGYINTTLNLQYIRKHWFHDNLPMFAVIIIASMISLMLMLMALKKATKRLPLLEELSKKALQDEPIDQNAYQQNKDNQAVWLYEQALFYLLNKEKKLQYALDKATSEISFINDAKLQQQEQSANFQSSLTQELKLSLDDVQAGLTLLENQYVSNEQKSAIEMIGFGVNDLNAKLNQLIQLNRLEKGQIGIEAQKFNPAILLSNLIDRFQNDAREKNILLSVKSYHADYILEGDAQKIQLIISSMLENALKFTDNGSVTITSQIQHLEKNIRWTIQVIDTGIGMDKAHLHDIFQPFFQINPNHKHSTNPNTIGLFLAKRYADIIHGDIEVDSQLGHGTTFRLHVLLKDWNSHSEQNVLQGKKFAIWYKNEAVLSQAKRLINTGVDISTFKDSELLFDFLQNNHVEMLIITFKIPHEQVLKIAKRLREFEQKRNFRTLITYFYQPKYLTALNAEKLKTAGVDYFENAIELDTSLHAYIERLIQYVR